MPDVLPIAILFVHKMLTGVTAIALSRLCYFEGVTFLA
ncbi:hypothetical protein CLV42_101716 [Chitinophaga ginsengisoli]|uniref:Uncharacterized protein n=1 Tax=Chitinophaga ginsengisoli TaxID=363837 RepID=A0A2P8GPR0_9BACT|nr:hypothetical protein CLV42_101716 [Chitinophaga ginsengisoli]